MDFVATPASMADGIKDVKRLYPTVDKKIAEKQIYDLTISGLLLTFASGSQIHQNGLLLHYLGCPLVKIDAIYRGAWSYEDAEKLLSKLEPQDQSELAAFLYARAYGEDALRGWRRAAFMRGLI
jgi:hypothetical protein